MGEVDIMMSRNNKTKAMAASMFLNVLGGVFSTTEKLGMKI